MAERFPYFITYLTKVYSTKATEDTVSFPEAFVTPDRLKQ